MAEKIVCWLTKMGTPPLVEKNGPSLMILITVDIQCLAFKWSGQLKVNNCTGVVMHLLVFLNGLAMLIQQLNCINDNLYRVSQKKL